MNTPNFWNFFETEAFPQLGLRQHSTRYVFEYLDRLNRAAFIVETGCTRQAGNWAGDGQSTVLLDRFIGEWPGSTMYSVDIDAQATAVCMSLVSDRVQIHTGDSVAFLRQLARNSTLNHKYIDVLYLDSFDVDFANPHLSAMHHIKELVAVSALIGPDTLVVVDDAPSQALLVQAGVQISILGQPIISGKGKYVADYARHVGVAPVFHGYQVGWIGL
jgi:hypothetical protein